MRRHPIFRALSHAANLLTFTAVLLVFYAAVWEFSTAEYLKGFSDAVLPQSGTTQQKAQAILAWMQHGPARESDVENTAAVPRDPEESLDRGGLLQVCGSATNAFVNLARAGGIPARRLLLLGADGQTRHVVAEVLIDGRWVVVDPVFHKIMTDDSGRLLTREDLKNPGVLVIATRGLAGYSPAYSYERTEHVRIEAIPLAGAFLRKALDRLYPDWEASPNWTLVTERQSFLVFLTGAVLLVLCLLLLSAIKAYGVSRIGAEVLTPQRYLKLGAAALFQNLHQGSEY